MYVLVRNDLPKGYQAAQALHAGIEYCMQRPEEARLWHDHNNTVVILSVPPEDLAEHLRKYSMVPFYEPDLGNQLTAIAGLRPRGTFQQYPLL